MSTESPHPLLAFNADSETESETETFDDLEIHLRRIAVEIVGQLPHDIGRAFAVLRYARELLDWVRK